MKEGNLVFAWKQRKTSMAQKSQPPSSFRSPFFVSRFSIFPRSFLFFRQNPSAVLLAASTKKNSAPQKIEAKSTSNALFADNGHRPTIHRPPIPESFLLFPLISLASHRHSPPSFLNGKKFRSGSSEAKLQSNRPAAAKH